MARPRLSRRGADPLSDTPPISGQSAARADQIVFYGTRWCGDCFRSRRLLDALGVPYRYVDIGQDPDAAALVVRLNRGMRSVPTIVFPDGSVLTEPTNAALEAHLASLSMR
jgi:mycoredoxin